MKVNITLILLLFSSILTAQVTNVKGQLTANNIEIDQEIDIYVDGKLVSSTRSNFSFTVPYGQHILTTSSDNLVSTPVNFTAQGKVVDLGTITMADAESMDINSNTPTIELGESDFDSDTDIGDEIPSLLGASFDAFESVSRFNLSRGGFRVRGMDGDSYAAHINGVPMGSLENGGVIWSKWGGLNDMFRNSNRSNGLEYSSIGITGLTGHQDFEIRAHKQRRQKRFSYSLGNTTYRQRVMGNYSTGLMDNGWAFSVAASRRWAEEGYVEGTPYYGYSYFVSVAKQINESNSLALTAFGAPTRRGRGGIATREQHDIAGTNYYNPNWGYQNGEKRNARIADSHQPIAMLTHEFRNENISLMTTAHYQWGKYGVSAFNWYDGSDPRPEYYRKWPSYIAGARDDQIQADLVGDILRNNEDRRQIDWHRLYHVNRSNFQEYVSPTGETISGNRAQYILEERRFDPTVLGLSSKMEAVLGETIIQTGIHLQQYKSDNHVLIDDMLGADYYVDVDKFAERDAPAGDLDYALNNLNSNTTIKREGDRIGYDYDATIQFGQLWSQVQFVTPEVDVYAGAQVSYTNFWRTGDVLVGRFPNNSFGDSEKSSFLNYGAKAGVSYKFNSRNYINLNASYHTKAPYFRNSFVSPRVRNQLVDNLTSQKILSTDASYYLRQSNFKVRVTGYFIDHQDRNNVRSFLLANAVRTDGGVSAGFVNYVRQNIDIRNMGIEYSIEYQPIPGLSLFTAGNIGDFRYSDRPNISVYLDSDPELQLLNRTSYLKNYHVPNKLQTGLSAGFTYRAPAFWFAGLTANYFDRVFLDVHPERRTLEAVSLSSSEPEFQNEVVERDSPLWNDILDQSKQPSAFSLDFYGGKSLLLNDYFSSLDGRMFLRFGLGVNNILNNQEIFSGGFEQFLFDYENKDVSIYPDRHFVSFGRTYFFNCSLTF